MNLLFLEVDSYRNKYSMTKIDLQFSFFFFQNLKDRNSV